MIKHNCHYCGGWEQPETVIGENKTTTAKPTISIKIEPYTDRQGNKVTKIDICSKCTKRAFDYIFGRIGAE